MPLPPSDDGRARWWRGIGIAWPGDRNIMRLRTRCVAPPHEHQENVTMRAGLVGLLLIGLAGGGVSVGCKNKKEDAAKAQKEADDKKAEAAKAQQEADAKKA